MATTARQNSNQARQSSSGLGGIQSRALAEGNQRSRLHPAELQTVRRRRLLSRPSNRTHKEDLEQAQRTVCGRAQKGRARHFADSQLHHRACVQATSIAKMKSSSVCKPRRRSSEPSCRMAAFGWFSMRSRRMATNPIHIVVETFTKYRKTHNEGVFDAYTADIRRCRSSHILTGLPDAYGRGRIIGDYRRVAALRSCAADRAQAGGETQSRLG